MSERKRLDDLSLETLQQLLASCGLVFSAPPFVFRLRAQVGELLPALRLAYGGYEILDEPAFIHFDLRVKPATGLRRWFKPLIELEFDGARPFAPLPRGQVFPLLEWAMNWCVTTSAQQYLMCHSAVLAQGEQALILPAPPGSGKSTLAAALMLSGWRLLSDELALLDPHAGRLEPFVRPVSLKNASIGIIGGHFPEAIFTPAVQDTVKGTVAHLRPTAHSMMGNREKAVPRWLVFPRFVAGVSWSLVPLGRPEAAIELAKNAFNLPVLGRPGFAALADMVGQCDCYSLEYGSLDEAIAGFAEIVEGSERGV
ncbi:HprK-related kinase A [Sulfuricystis multivorans]|uniref:HprK-related kinase A n=1 Tax=Sulfuricystis multivorans TaxID=2211108 RepID=UPI0015594DAF|nr:HprK-related kinase A [Sulfuricystis multivorans]